MGGVATDGVVVESGRSIRERIKRAKLATGKALWYRVRIEGSTLLDAWRAVKPDSAATDRSSEVQASRLLNWYEQNHHPTVMEAFDSVGLTITHAVRVCKDATKAEMYIWDGANQSHVAKPDHKVRLMAVDRMLKLVGLDRKVRRELTIGMEEAPNQINTPPESASVEEWDRWRQAVEADKLERHRSAQAEMARIRAEQGIPEATALIGPER